MTLNQGMTVGAIGFALFALVFIARTKPSGQAAVQPGQAQRDAGLWAWSSLTSSQTALVDQAFGHYADELERKLS